MNIVLLFLLCCCCRCSLNIRDLSLGSVSVRHLMESFVAKFPLWRWLYVLAIKESPIICDQKLSLWLPPHVLLKAQNLSVSFNSELCLPGIFGHILHPSAFFLQNTTLQSCSTHPWYTFEPSFLGVFLGYLHCQRPNILYVQ